MSAEDGTQKTIHIANHRRHATAPTLDPNPGPEPQWSADGQWWWDGGKWTQMWKPPRGLEWSDAGWVRPTEGADAPAEPEVPIQVDAPTPSTQPTPPPPPPTPQPAAPAAAQPAVVAPQRPGPFLQTAPAPAPALLAGVLGRRLPARMTWLAAAGMALLLVGISTVLVAGALTRPQDRQGGAQSQLRTGHATPTQIAQALTGRSFTRDVVPPELGDAAPLRDVFVADSAPGLIGQASTTTSDLGGIVTFYVFADPVWAEAFYESPPTAFGCGVCTSMGDATEVHGVGDRATSYVLYRKKVGGQGWVATTTYVLSGSVVIDGLYFPVNVSNPSPSATDLAVPTAYTKAGLQLLSRI